MKSAFLFLTTSPAETLQLWDELKDSEPWVSAGCTAVVLHCWNMLSSSYTALFLDTYHEPDNLKTHSQAFEKICSNISTNSFRDHFFRWWHIYTSRWQRIDLILHKELLKCVFLYLYTKRQWTKKVSKAFLCHCTALLNGHIYSFNSSVLS